MEDKSFRSNQEITRPLEKMQISLGLEGSANKLGVGIIAHPTHGPASVLSNIRHTYITPPGEGFQPNHTAKHHKTHITRLIKEAMTEAKLTSKDLDCISYVRPSNYVGCKYIN